MRYQMQAILTPAEKRNVSAAEKVRDKIAELEAERAKIIEKMIAQKLPDRLIARATGTGHQTISRTRKSAKRNTKD